MSVIFSCIYSKRFLKKSAAVIFSVIFSTKQYISAATNGELGPDSSGTIDVSLHVNDLMKIDQLKNINLGALPKTVSNLGVAVKIESEPHDFFVYSNISDTYEISFSSKNNNVGYFSLKNGTGRKITYAINFFCNGEATGTPILVDKNDVAVNGTNASQNVSFESAPCNAAMQILLYTPANLYSGTYNDVLTITVRPH